MKKQIVKLGAPVALALAASSALANSGVQLPLNQYSAGTETTDSSLITNPGFETVDGNLVPTGWTPNLPTGQNIFRGVAPDPANLPTPASVLQTKSAQAFQAGGINPFQDFKISQTITLAPNTDYVISGYIWNYAFSGPPPQDDLFAGDLAVLEVVDPNDPLINAGVIVEPTSRAGNAGSGGHFTYKTFNSSQFPTSTVQLEVEFDPNQDLNFGQNRPDLSAQFDNIALTPLATFAAQRWNNAAGGDWQTAGNWVNGPVNQKGAVATFKVASSGNAPVSLNGSVNLTAINFDADGGYALGAGTIVMDHEERNDAVIINNLRANNSISAPITVGVGTANIGGTVLWPRPMRANVAANTVLTISGGINPGSVGTLGAGTFDLTKTGAGRLDAFDFDARQLFINQGTLKLLPNNTAAQRVKVGTLSIAGGTTPTAKLDMSNSALVVDYTDPSPLAEIKAQILAGYTSGTWGGQGIVTSQGSGYGVGYAEASQLATLPAAFGAVDSSAVLLRGTLYGDGNLDGVVNITDFAVLAANFNRPGEWVHGNYNYDTVVNITDFALLSANFNRVAGSLPRAAIPEPATLLLIPAMFAMRRRR